jgi:hypothetical protein
MNTLREALVEYLQLRRSLGFKLKDAGLQLPRFVTFLEGRGSTHITTEHVRMRKFRCCPMPR